MTTEELHVFLQNPENFGENRVPAHSDHFYYESEKDLEKGEDMPLRQSLNGTWKFVYSKNLFERPVDFVKEDYDISKLDDIIVPGHIEMQGYDEKHYTNADYPWDGKEELYPPMISKDFAPVGSYATNFKVEKALRDKPLFISFQGVETAFRLFVNGQYVGYGEDSFTPTEFEITNYVHSGKNRIALEVYKRTSASWLEDQDFWRFFGIFRDVYLYAVPSLHVKDMFVKATLDSNYEKGILDLCASTNATVSSATLELFEGKEKVFAAPVSISENNLSLHMEGLVVKHWSAEEPNLYECRITLKDETGEVKEIAVTKIGFRTFELKDKLMLFNGKRILFKGANRHEFSSLHGRAATKEEMLWDIKTFKRNNINAVRTCHYPNQSMWYRLCDEYGIYMIDETNLETHGTWAGDIAKLGDYRVPGDKPEWKGAVLDRANSMFQRDKNHAAIVMWSLGNESHGGSNFIAMHDFFREVDDTRIVHYEGVIHDPSCAAATDVYSQMYAKPQDISKYLDSDPSKPYISCEYMHAMGNSLGGMKLYTDLEDKYPMYQGGFIWDYLDQALWQEHNGRMRLAYGGDFGDRATEYCFCTDGLVFANRVESPKCPEAKNLYANVHMWVDDSEIKIENRNLFTDLSRYSFIYTVTANAQVVYTKKMDDVSINPGDTKVFETGFKQEKDSAKDYVFKIEMVEKEATKWAEAGYMVAFAESTSFAGENPVLLPVQKKSFKHVAKGNGNVGANNDDYSVIFRKVDKYVHDGWVSLKDHGKEIITMPPAPTFFRAYVDNDKGFRLQTKSHLWHMLSLYPFTTLTKFEDKGEYVEAEYDYAYPDDESIHSTVNYKAYPESRVEVTIHYYGKENLPIMPLFGWEMKLDKEYNNIEYFGKGPVENYRDRNNGVYTDVFKTTVEENLTPYLVPQEVGNRTGVRYAKITNNEGHGLLFAAKKETFELGFLPYSAYEMENATHLDELPERSYSWIRIMEGQMGVGGDDTWGAPVQEIFRLDSSKDMELTFEIRLI